MNLAEALQKVPTGALLAEIARRRRSPGIERAHTLACESLILNPEIVRANRNRHRILIPARHQIIRLLVETLGFTSVAVAGFYGLDPSGIGHAIRADKRRCQDSHTHEQKWISLRRTVRESLTTTISP